MTTWVSIEDDMVEVGVMDEEEEEDMVGLW